IPDRVIVRHRLLAMPIRTSSLRSLGAFLNVFAIESFMDELAAAAGADPVEFRLAHLTDPRGRRVIEQAAQMSGWAGRGGWPARDQPETGAGEVAQGPVAGAIGNAVADAVGVRVRGLPLTREQVARAIEES